MNDLRTAAQQALEALKVAVDHYHTYHGHPGTKFQQAIDDLRAALAQQKDPTDPGNDVDVLREHVRHLERRVRELHAQQAEPVAGVVLNEEGRAALVEHGREEWHCVSRNARRLYTAPPKDEPKPMHPELRKMWEDHFDKCFRAMPVPKQAEPVEQLAELQAMLRAEVDRLIAAGIQPQRKLVPLTEEEIEHIGITHQSLRQVARAVERAVWEKNHG